MPSLLSNLSALLPSQGSSPVGSAPIPASALRSYLLQQPAYKVNRERAAVVIKEGLGLYELWTGLKPVLFIGGLAGMAVSGAAIYRRRSAAKEAMVLYATTFLVSAAAAWVARPGTAASPPPGAPSNYGGVIAEIDGKRAQYTAEDPNWVEETYQSLAALPGVEADLDANPLVKAIVL